MAAREVTVPDIGDFADVPVIEILVSEGDEITVDQPLVTLESDKATMDVPAPFAGKVAELRVSVGDEVSEGSVLLTVEAAGTATELRRREPRIATEPETAERSDGDEAAAAPEAAPAAEARRQPSPRRPRSGRNRGTDIVRDPGLAMVGRSMRGPPCGGWRGRWGSSSPGDRHRAQGPDHEGRREAGQGAPRRARRPRAPRSPGSTSRRGRRSTSRSTARSSGCR